MNNNNVMITTDYSALEARTMAHLMNNDLKVINGAPMMSHIQIGDLLTAPGEKPRYDNVKRTMVRLVKQGVIQLTPMEEVNSPRAESNQLLRQ